MMTRAACDDLVEEEGTTSGTADNQEDRRNAKGRSHRRDPLAQDVVDHQVDRVEVIEDGGESWCRCLEGFDEGEKEVGWEAFGGVQVRWEVIRV